jgi:hypothetical protein
MLTWHFLIWTITLPTLLIQNNLILFLRLVLRPDKEGADILRLNQTMVTDS